MKNIALIGSSHGIGLKTTKIPAPDHQVITASRISDNLEGIDVRHLKFDVTKDKIEDLDLPETIGGLVYFPGSIHLKAYKMLKPEAIEEALNLNFISLVKVVQGLLPKLKKSEKASLVFFSSLAVKVGMPFHTSVAAAKGAIEGFSKALEAKYAPGFRINVIAPSLTGGLSTLNIT